MAKPARSRIRHLESAAKSSAPVIEKATVGLFRWATTDHIGKGRAFENIPTVGFFRTLEYIMAQLIFGILGAVLTGVIAYIGIVYGIPLLFDLAFSG